MSDRTCHYCDAGHDEVDLRPYGPGGDWVCLPCARATPEREAEAKRQFRLQLEAAEAASPTGAVVIDPNEDGPQPYAGGPP